MFKRILFATDFSPHAEVAKKVAITLAKEHGKRLWALTVLEPVEEPLTEAEEPPEVPPTRWEKALEREEEELEREEERRLKQDVAEIEAAGVNVTKLMREGDPEREIVAAAQEIGADLIVMGSHSRRNIWDVGLGSTAEKVAKSALCPVLIVSHLPTHTIEAQERILFATDFSPHSQVAEKVALSLAKENGQRLWALTVIEPGGEIPIPPGFAASAPGEYAIELEQGLAADVEAEASRRLDRVVDAGQTVGVQVEKLVRHGYATGEIVRVAQEIRADLIVMGSHSRRNIWDVLLGNTAEKVAKSAPCPVLVVSHQPSPVPASEGGE